ncbi:PAS domain S-box protein [Leptolyngbya sp. FACHB-36]|uniref:PAS domain-containing protein n=1 Tax=Leptolyngbya sp. FACHB-36 TaxID=2692808 RepID=UPI001681AE68|nr:PAS domain S-box protein [Leptolyngbya sp. FACHB-36]MBD2020180.1 PAS domain S-box protein [Leptolyngbya sp. FACHB-36]
MVSSFWNIPGIQSEKALEFLEQLLNPLCVYDDRGQAIYATQSFLELLRIDRAIGFFDFFASQLSRRIGLTEIWERALHGERIGFSAKPRDAEDDIECSLQFNPDAKLMFLTAQKADVGGITKLIAAYEQAIARSAYSSLAAALIDPNGTIVTGNQRLHDLLGTTDRETLNIEAFVHPTDRLVDAKLRQKLFNGEINSYTAEKRFVSRQSEIVWMNVSASLIELSTSVHGFTKYFAVLFEDITESKKTYSALIKTEEKWKTLVLDSPYLFIQASNTGQILYVSPAIERILGYKEEELLGQYITEFIHPNNFNEFELVLQLWGSDSDCDRPDIECWWRMKSGRWVSLHLQGQRFPLALGIDGIVISGHNITDRKCLEVELQASEEKFRSLILNIPGAVFRCDSSYRMDFISDEIENITGYPSAVFVNNQVRSYLSIVHSDDILLIKDSLIQSVLDRHRCSIEYRIIHADGSVRWVAERKQGVFDQNGRLLWFDGVLIDVSKRKQIEVALHQLQDNQPLKDASIVTENAIDRPKMLPRSCSD